MLKAFGWVNLVLLTLFITLSMMYLLYITLRQVFIIVRQWWRIRKAKKLRLKLEKEREEQMQTELAE